MQCLLFVVVLCVVGCHQSIPPGQTTSTSVLPAAQEPYVPSLSGVAFGNTFARATTDGAPATDDKVAASDRPITATASKHGDELKRSCGKDAAQSHAQATATFQPLPIAGVRQFGFALSTTAYAKGGAWRGRFLLCGASHNTVATADARATGRVDLTFTPKGSESDELFLRVLGATPGEAHLEVRDAQNQPVPLNAVPGQTSVTATLTTPGRYSVHASIASHAEKSGSGNAPGENRTSFSVTVQTTRDALALGYGPEPTNDVVLPVPIFVSTEAMSTALDSALFTDRRRLYPCAKVACGAGMRDVYVESPRVSTNSGSVVLDMNLSGSYEVAVIFGGKVSGTIRTTAVPVVERDTLRFDSPTFDVATDKLIVRWKASTFHQRLLDRIKNVRIDLAPQLQSAVAKAQEHFSASRGGACLLLAPKEAHVRSVQVVTTEPQGVVVTFDIELSEVSGNACSNRKPIH
jgi:hypothetical protein